MTVQLPKFDVQEYTGRKTKYCLCIPVINEGDKLLKQLDRAKKIGIEEIVDIIICDGDSKDGSTTESNLKNRGVNTLLIKKDAGKLSAQLRMGYWWALERGYDGIITIDGNGKDSIESVPLFIEKLEQGYDFIQGSRYIKGGSAVNTPLSRSVSVKLLHAPIISSAAGYKFTDTTNGFRGYSRKYLEHPRVVPFRNVFNTYELVAYLSVRASQLGLKVCEVPVSRTYPKGKTPTKISPFRGNIVLMAILLKTWFGIYNLDKNVFRKKILALVLLFLTCITLFLGYYKNYWVSQRDGNPANELFSTYQLYSDGIIFSTLSYDNKFGFSGGDLKIYRTSSVDSRKMYLDKTQIKKENFVSYPSQFGLQVMGYLSLDRLLPFSNSLKVRLFYAINALLTAAAVTFVIAWLSRRTTSLAGFVLWAFFVFYDKWFLLFATSLYWVSWTWFLPLIASIYLLSREEKYRIYSDKLAFGLMFVSLFVKTLCGFEYISTILIAMVVPFVYFSILNKWKLSLFVKRVLIVGAGAVGGFILAVIAYLVKLSLLVGSISSAYQILLSDILNRTSGDPEKIVKLLGEKASNPEALRAIEASLRAPVIDVVKMYLDLPIRLGTISIHYYQFVYGAIVASLIGLFMFFYCSMKEKDRRNMLALISATWISLLAPISWFVLAKAHSYIHTYLNFVLWNLPFTFFALTLFSFVIYSLIKSCCKRLP